MSPHDVSDDGDDIDGADDARRRRRRIDVVRHGRDDDDGDWIRARVASAFQSSIPTTTTNANANANANAVTPRVSDIARGIERAIAVVREMTTDAIERGFAGVVEEALASDVARETFEDVERRQARDSREIMRLTECLREQKREIDGLRERLGREIIHNRQSDGGFEEEEDAATAVNKARAECELWREACGKFRKRAEHYERLYKETVLGASQPHSMMVVPETQVLASSLDREKRAPVATRAVRDNFFKRAMRGEPGVVKHRVVVHNNPGDHGSDHGHDNAVVTTVANDDVGGLWGGTQPTAARRRRDAPRPPPPPTPVVGDSENPMHDLRADIELGRREHAAPLNRIFLDANTSGAGDETRNRVRKNKRLSDNAPTPANEIFELPPAAGVSARELTIEPAPGASNKQVKYVEVVRKKSEREQLDAYVCEECRTFYNAMMPEKQPATIKCTHEPPSNANNSRHRAKWAPEPAPKGFWNLAFTPPETTE